MVKISKKLARSIGDVIQLDWNEIDLDQFHKGVQVEMEHGSKLGEKTNITKNDLIVTGKIALAHLLELPDYYSRLEKLEQNNQMEEARMSRTHLQQLISEIISEQFDTGDVLQRNLGGEGKDVLKDFIQAMQEATQAWTDLHKYFEPSEEADTAMIQELKNEVEFVDDNLLAWLLNIKEKAKTAV